MKLQQLRYLVAVVDNGLNITSAAHALFTSQPGVSKQIKLLEDELSLRLFERRGKSIAALTEAGEEVVARARKILTEVGRSARAPTRTSRASVARRRCSRPSASRPSPSPSRRRSG